MNNEELEKRIKALEDKLKVLEQALANKADRNHTHINLRGRYL